MIPLTRRQHEILDYFRTYQGERGISPTLEEIAAHLGVNKVTIFGHVAELERKGVLKKAARGVSRALQLVDDGARPTSLPILGRIAAGTPIEAVEAPEWLDLAELVPQGREVFALRVQGDSMIDDAIREGDIVLVERRSTAHNGETVVAVLPDGEATLKRFYREADGTIRLQPANARLSPLRVREVEIRGVVIGVVRRF
jgi:repressor LexA